MVPHVNPMTLLNIRDRSAAPLRRSNQRLVLLSALALSEVREHRAET